MFLFIFIHTILDRMFVCVRDESNENDVINSLTSIILPKLQRTYISYSAICGFSAPDDGTSASDCSVKLYMYKALEPTENEFQTELFYEIPSDKLLNDGSLKISDEWFYIEHKVPHTSGDQRLRFLASFDSKYGGFGLDNVHFHTPQM